MKHASFHLPFRLILMTLLLVTLAWLSSAAPKAANAAATATIVHNFNFRTEGNQPGGGLTQGPDGSLYGVTENGSIVFKIAPDGTFSILHKFGSFTDGSNTTAKLLLVGHLLFGTCASGGGNNLSQSYGTVFQIDMTKVDPADNTTGFSIIHYFGGTANGDGADSESPLFQASDGNLYGTTRGGGAAGLGTIFQIKPDAGGQFSVTPRTSPSGQDTFNGTYNKIHDFTGGAGDGASPLSGVVQGPGGFLYGVTVAGGSKSDGVVYKIGTDGLDFTLLHTFTGGNQFNGTPVGDGSGPQSDLLFASDGNLYGTTFGGGTGNGGTVFQIKPGADGVIGANASFQTLHNFTGITDGTGLPFGVTQASDGNLYGATYTGGANGVGSGSVFQIAASAGQFSAASPFSTVFTFSGNNQFIPRNIESPIIQGSNGMLYGETLAGGQLADGSSANGTVFAIFAGLPALRQIIGVTGTISPPNVTSADTTLIIDGQNFGVGDTVTLDGQAVTDISRDYSQTNEKITATLAAPISAGSHTLIVAGTGQPSTFTFTVTLLAPSIRQVTNASGDAVTTFDTVLSISGDSFASGDIVHLDGATLPNAVFNSGSLLTVTPPQSLSAGDHTITVVHAAPDNRASNSYTLTVQAGGTPVITRITEASSSHPITTNDTTLVVHGTSFADGDVVVITGTDASVTVAGQDLSNAADEQITATLSHLLSVGTYKATVTHAAPDNRSSSAFSFTVTVADPPQITYATYHANGDGTSNVVVTGTNFVAGCGLNITNSAQGTTLAVLFKDSTQVEGDLNKLLPAGDHAVTVTNPDGQSATVTITTMDAPIIVSPTTAVTDTSGVVHVVISGHNFATPGYNSNPLGSILVVRGVDAQGNQTIVKDVLATDPANSDGAQQFSLTLDSTDVSNFAAYDHYLVEVFNTDAQSSGPAVFNIYPNDQTQYAVAYDGNQLLQNYQLFLQMSGTPTGTVTSSARQGQSRALRPNAASAPPQINPPVDYAVDPIGIATLTIHGTNLVRGGFVTITNFLAGTTSDSTLQGSAQVGTNIVVILSKALPAGDHSITVTNPDGQASSVTLSIAASTPTQVLLGQVTTTPPAVATAIAARGFGTAVTGLIGQDGNGLIGQDGNGLIGQDGNGIISQDGNSAVSQNGSPIVGQGGGNIVGQGGGNFTGHVAGAGVHIVNAIAAVVSADGVTGSLGLTPQFGPTGSARAAHAASTAPLSFILTKHDVGPTRGQGPTDLKVSLNHTDGTSALLLDLRFTPGQPDVVVYQAPGVTLTPRLGGTAPAVTSPAPTLTSLSPTTAVAGTPGVTLTVTGTFFTAGTVVNWNGQPLATTALSDTQATAVVPANLLTITGAMPVTVTNPAPGGGSSASLPFTVTPATHLFAAGLQMFSVPADYSALPLTQALTALSPRLAVWTPTQAQYAITPISPADALRPGQGYWARFSAATGLIGPGVSTRTDQAFSIALAAGWNMIGDPFPSAVALSSVQVQATSGTLGTFGQAVTAGALSGTLYTYGAGDTQYQTIGANGSLTPYLGAWIYAYHPCTLQVPVPASPN